MNSEKVVMVEDEPIEEQKIPEGLVRVGSLLVDRAEIVFHLAADKNDPSVLRAIDGTIYRRQSNGSLKRIWPLKSRPRKRNA